MNMKQMQISRKMFGRFGWIDKFVARYGRLPMNQEISDKFEISPGYTSLLVIRQYLRWRKFCPLCRKRRKRVKVIFR